MLKQVCVASSVVLVVFAGQMALAGPVLELDPGLMGLSDDGVVVSQQPDLGSGSASDTDYISFSTGGPFWQLLTDDILLSQCAVVRRITWWGFYGADFDKTPGAHNPPNGDETMRIRLYSARAGDGLPDSSDIIFQESFLNPSRTATGRTLLLPGIPAEYRFNVDLSLPLNLNSGFSYWIEIAQFGEQTSHFRWQRGNGPPSPFAFLNPSLTDWRGVPGNLAFQLSTVPEPSSLSLLSLSVLLNTFCGLRGRRVAPR